MPRRSNAFQQVVLLLHERLSGEAIVTESKELPDARTGTLREIDVVIEASPGGYPVVLSIECLDHNRSATVEWVERMWGKHADLPTNKLILISRLGFSQNAQNKAAALNITTFALDEVSNVNWTRIVGKLASIYIETLDSQYQGFALIVNEAGEVEQRPVQFGTELHSQDGRTVVFAGTIIDHIISTPEVGRVFLDHMDKESKAENVFTVDHGFSAPMVILESGQRPVTVKAIRMVFTAKRSQTPVPLAHGAIRGAPVAYGEATGETGQLRVSVVEKEGQQSAIEVRKREGTNWRKLVNVGAK